MARRKGNPGIRRSSDFWRVAYFLSRWSIGADPPRPLETTKWEDVYSGFFAALGDGRTRLAFKNSLKNARDSFDKHTPSGRIGWQDENLPKNAAAIQDEMGRLTEADAYAAVSSFFDPTAKGQRSRAVSKDLPESVRPDSVRIAATQLDSLPPEEINWSTTYEIEVDQREYPPLEILARALSLETGQEWISSDLAARSEEFDLLANAGFRIAKKLSDDYSKHDKEQFLDPSEDEPAKDETGSEKEGGRRPNRGTRIERSRTLRDKCLKHHGHACKVCDLRFEDRYGEIGRDFIHVHHLRPLAETGERKTNPHTDLVPVCPNCHAMLHKRDPPLELESLKERLMRKDRISANDR